MRIIALTLLLVACRESTTTKVDAAGSANADAISVDAPAADASATSIMDACMTSCVALEACMSFPGCVTQCVEDVTQAGCNAQELDAIKACATVACSMMMDCLTSIPCLMQ